MSTIADKPEFEALTIPQVCALTKVSRGTIYNEISAGRLRASKIGARTVILVGDLRDYMFARRLPIAA